MWLRYGLATDSQIFGKKTLYDVFDMVGNAAALKQ